MNIVEAAIKHRQITLLLTMILVLTGFFSLQNMPRRENPKMTIRQGLVIMVYPGATAKEMEAQVTKKVESLLFNFKEVKKDQTESTTMDGEMVIQVELQDWVTDSDQFWSKARHDLYELKGSSLPRGVIGPIIKADFGDTVALLIAISSDRHTYTELEDFVEIIEDELRPLPEVSKLKRYGAQQEQIYVTSSSLRMAQYGLSQEQLIHALQSMNSISYAGEIKTDGSEIPIHVESLYDSPEKIRRQIVHISPDGDLVRIEDVAEIERRYVEPNSFIRVNGRDVLMLSVEMQEGFNIVDFGEKVDKRLLIAGQRFPSDVLVKKMIDQPSVVNEDIKHFMKEFAIAIVAVILVTILLLPLRIAVVAALAIPVTVMITFSCLDIFDVDLQQMTLAGLIVVLGMVVDNAIVVVDDYVERLDQGTPPLKAAVRSATELFVPVFSATLAIICAFIPLNFIVTGNAGEFLHTLPIAVTVALVVSLVVAILIIPLLCFLFIKTGLHSADAPKSFSFLGLVQRLYDKMLVRAFKRPILPIALGLLSFAGTAWLASQVQVRMFPKVERNQFCLEVYMDKGVRLEATDRAVQKIEQTLREDERVVDLTSFVGTGSPRFYTTYAPQPPDVNYAQILITTTSADAADGMLGELVTSLHNFLPNGEILIKQLQQGPPVDAPIEIRVVGNDLQAIKRIGEDVVTILKQTPGTNFVRTTFQQDYLGIHVTPKDEVVNRLGLTSKGIAQTLAGGFKGAPVSTLWEGDNPIDILLRLDEESRDEFEDISNTYIQSPITGFRVPLRQVAELDPQWQTGRIRRRNGVRTLTVRSEAQLGRLPNEILADVRPKIEAIELPLGVTISYGGELEDQVDVLGQQSASLVTSLVLIFIVLLFQFKSILRSLLIMVSIPMSWFGGFLGLFITGNPISVTGFLGLISLSGLVVRNGIILVDYADKLLAREPTRDLREVAMEAAKRRMRPVFLTAMAAAMGVVPMIISGSPLWAPLGAVVSVGLVFGLILTLTILPILYWLVLRPHGGQRQAVADVAATCEAQGISS